MRELQYVSVTPEIDARATFDARASGWHVSEICETQLRSKTQCLSPNV